MLSPVRCGALDRFASPRYHRIGRQSCPPGMRVGNRSSAPLDCMPGGVEARPDLSPWCCHYRSQGAAQPGCRALKNVPRASITYSTQYPKAPRGNCGAGMIAGVMGCRNLRSACKHASGNTTACRDAYQAMVLRIGGTGLTGSRRGTAGSLSGLPGCDRPDDQLSPRRRSSRQSSPRGAPPRAIPRTGPGTSPPPVPPCSPCRPR